MQALALYAQGDGPAPASHEVKHALDWIVEVACGTFEEPFVAGKSDVTDYLMGRRSVGLAIIRAMKFKPELLEND